MREASARQVDVRPDGEVIAGHQDPAGLEAPAAAKDPGERLGDADHKRQHHAVGGTKTLVAARLDSARDEVRAAIEGAPDAGDPLAIRDAVRISAQHVRGAFTDRVAKSSVACRAGALDRLGDHPDVELWMARGEGADELGAAIRAGVVHANQRETRVRLGRERVQRGLHPGLFVEERDDHEVAVHHDSRIA